LIRNIDKPRTSRRNRLDSFLRIPAKNNHTQDFILGHFGGAPGPHQAAVFNYRNPVGKIKDIM
jgi:hypothetical protein